MGGAALLFARRSAVLAVAAAAGVVLRAGMLVLCSSHNI